MRFGMRGAHVVDACSFLTWRGIGVGGLGLSQIIQRDAWGDQVIVEQNVFGGDVVYSQSGW